MGAAILFQKSYIVSNGKPTLPPAIRRKHWPVCVKDPLLYEPHQAKSVIFNQVRFKLACSSTEAN